MSDTEGYYPIDAGQIALDKRLEGIIEWVIAEYPAITWPEIQLSLLTALSNVTERLAEDHFEYDEDEDADDDEEDEESSDDD